MANTTNKKTKENIVTEEVKNNETTCSEDVLLLSKMSIRELLDYSVACDVLSKMIDNSTRLYDNSIREGSYSDINRGYIINEKRILIMKELESRLKKIAAK